MFSVKKMIRISQVRNVSRSFKKRDVDPGIRLRKQILQTNEEIEDFDDLEADFMDLGKSHREHVAQMKHMVEKEKFHIVKHKYFNEKFPNFLTWNDKEQIRYLHSTNPEEWTIESLSEGFPALPEVVKKIIKSKWTKNASKIKNHDLAKGQLPDLPNDLSSHLNKFTNRRLNLKPFEIPSNKEVVEIPNKNIRTEFSDIISSYEELKNKNKREKDNKETGKKKTVKGNFVTLQKLQSDIRKEAVSGKSLSEEDKILVKGLQEFSENDNKIDTMKETIVDITKNKYEAKDEAIIKKRERDYSHLVYPEKIIIPKEIWKNGLHIQAERLFLRRRREIFIQGAGNGLNEELLTLY
ncbi:hypothetical protein NQ318_013906 [Aromia moschata]|uniref:Neugrin n=1 Tax=Aromia moschata TaxID=1265417 RepID=A0AAV8Z8N6_9CUCU|nr:hypothetical protein NQ318_013906 [Aromia moschata]